MEAAESNSEGRRRQIVRGKLENKQHVLGREPLCRKENSRKWSRDSLRGRRPEEDSQGKSSDLRAKYAKVRVSCRPHGGYGAIS